MSETSYNYFYAGAYWGPRPESEEECARRLMRCLRDLAETDDLLGHWYKKGWSRKQATESEVLVDEETLTTLVHSGRARGDFDRSVIPELGYSVSLWNGDSKRSADFSVLCGATTSTVPNNFVLHLPQPEEAPGLLQTPAAMSVLRAAITAWDPEWATWTSHSIREPQLGEEQYDGRRILGWATYLTIRAGIEAGSAPDGIRIEPFGSGFLITLGDSPTGVARSLVLETQAFLGDLLQP